MTQFLASYDLTAKRSPHSEFLDQAEKVGWSRWIWGPKTQKWLRLPNTTLVGDFASSNAAKTALDRALSATSAALGTTVEMPKHLIGTFTGTNYNSDEKADPAI